MLRGSLTETKFQFPAKIDSEDVSPKALRMTNVNTYKEGEVTYISDNVRMNLQIIPGVARLTWVETQIGLHKITSGKGSGKPAVSLHRELYRH